MKKEFEPGNVKEIIDSIPERNLEKEDDIDKEAHRLEGCLYFLRGYMGGDAELHPERVYTGADIVELLDTVIHGRE
ncbi:hypothetical protein [Clostridium fessum]|uniref:hypothetical protein n=1 Tax=Clostridium fessum TaxID=2126740 RepID=UPI003AF0B1FE